MGEEVHIQVNKEIQCHTRSDVPELLLAKLQAQAEFLRQCFASMTVSTTLSRVLDWTRENTQ